MRTLGSIAGRSPRRVRALLVLACASGALSVVLLAGPGGATPRAGAQSGGGASDQTDASIPARNVIMLGSSPRESAGETWGIGQVGSNNNPTFTIVRYAEGAGWSTQQMLDSQGQPLAQFKPDDTPLAGSITPGGSGALLGTVSHTGEEPSEPQTLLVRNPGGSFREAPAVPEALLPAGETLFSAARAPLLAAVDEAGAAGAFVVPVVGGSSGSEGGVLHWNGHEWGREKIQLSSGDEAGFRVLAIAASSPSNAWLLGQLPEGVALFRRDPNGEPAWKPVAPSSSGVPGERLTAEGQPFTEPGAGEPPLIKTQALTVTEQGVWVDGQRSDVNAPVTMFFSPEGQNHGRVTGTWCNLPGTAPPGSAPCKFTLPESLPSTARSFAWANESLPYGERVISGLPEDVTLRLAGSTFERVLAFGANGSATQGAAYSEPEEGWLGDTQLPVHVTRHLAPNQLEDRYPVPFRFALLAIAPQPDAPVGALTSEALAVGDNGEVARYAPGEGWAPESLLGPGGRRATPRLRAVAWPTPTRSFAVGELGQMWLWRAETNLWEPDPAAPRNFRGNLMGIAFDPNNPTRGYAVGQGGVLLRYGKSWSQETLPPEVAGASFTSIAFAGSEAIVAFRIPHEERGVRFYTGGLLVNSGAGWHVDQAAAAALAPEGSIPWAVAALPDGGAALSGETLGEEPIVMERSTAGAGWEKTSVPYPPASRTGPGSLALFRENGALRVIGSGSIPRTREIDFPEPPPPAGLPATLIKPYPVATGHVLRQTANGWSDEEHQLNFSVTTEANFVNFDTPLEPDPTAAVLVDATGSQGWAVGGEIESGGEGRLDTADVARYPNDHSTPPGVGSTPIAADSTNALFAIAGDAQCGEPCADRQNDQLGPDVWLSSAIQQASRVSGVRGFFDLGPRVTNGETSNKKVAVEIPYSREFERYASLLHGGPITGYPVASPTDLAGAAGECPFDQTFGDFAWAEAHAASCAGAYYAFSSTGPAGTVRVIVLDQAGGVDATPLEWVKEQLAIAASGPAPVPAIVLGNADLVAQSAAGEPGAVALASALVKPDGASAYFYDSTERNAKAFLRVGRVSIPAFGSGTLGYVRAVNAAKQDFIGQSGFLLAEVNAHPAARNKENGLWPVTARLIPNVGELALEAQDGVLLHRSQQGLFAGLARRPRAGCESSESRGGFAFCATNPYIPIPANCIGPACASGISPEYEFSSSRPDIGNFVAKNISSPDPRAVLLDSKGEPVEDRKSGLFCAYNAGTTVVTITAGGLSSSLTVTVQAGSVRRPCGTVPLKELPVTASSAVSPPAPAPAPTPAGTPPTSSPTPLSVPVPLAPVAAPAAAPAPGHPAPASFFVPPVPPTPILAFVPPPVPTPARPSPPSGTSAVTSPIEVAEHEEEEEEATESVANQAVAYHASDHEPAPEYLLGLILLAAIAGVSVRRRPRGGRRGARLATVELGERRRRTRRDVNRW